MRSVVLLVAMILFAGCTVTKPVVSEYRIDPEIKSLKSSAMSCKEKSLKVAQLFSSSSLMSQRMKYTQDGYQEFSFTESKWALSPNRAINDMLVRTIREAKLFRSVNSFKSRSRSDLILEATLEEFIQHFREDNKKSYVRVVISFTLVDAKIAKILHTKSFIQEVEVDTLNAKGGVVALNRALGTLLSQSNSWLGEICR